MPAIGRKFVRGTRQRLARRGCHPHSGVLHSRATQARRPNSSDRLIFGFPDVWNQCRHIREILDRRVLYHEASLINHLSNVMDSQNGEAHNGPQSSQLLAGHAHSDRRPFFWSGGHVARASDRRRPFAHVGKANSAPLLFCLGGGVGIESVAIVPDSQ